MYFRLFSETNLVILFAYSVIFFAYSATGVAYSAKASLIHLKFRLFGGLRLFGGITLFLSVQVGGQAC